MDISNQIKTRREAMGLSQEQLAEKLYVSRQTISNWERDKTYPDVQSLLLLSNVFGVTVDSLIKGDVETMAQVMKETTTVTKKTLLRHARSSTHCFRLDSRLVALKIPK